MLLFLLLSCRFENNEYNRKPVRHTESDKLKFVLNKWREDSLGCLNYRNIKTFNKLIKGYKLSRNNTSKQEFLKILGKPNEELKFSDFQIIVYYFESICLNNLLIKNSDKSSIRIKFNNQDKYLEIDTRIE